MGKKYALEDRVVDRGTNVSGTVVLVGEDEYGAVFEVNFDQRIFGRRRHQKREIELKKEPLAKRRASDA